MAADGHYDFADRAFREHVYAPTRSDQCGLYFLCTCNFSNLDFWSLRLRLGLSHPCLARLLCVAIKEGRFRTQTLSLETAGFCPTYCCSVHVRLAYRVPSINQSRWRTADTRVQQSPGNEQLLADVSLSSSSYSFSFYLRLYDRLFPRLQRLLHLRLPLWRLFRHRRQNCAGENTCHGCLQSMWTLHSDLHFKRHGSRRSKTVWNGCRSWLHEMYGLHKRLSQRRFVFWFW